MKKLLVVVIIVVIVALLAAYKCSRSRGGEEEVQPTPAPVEKPAAAAEEAPKAEEPAKEEPAPAEEVKEEAAPEQKEEAAAPAPAKKEKQEAKPASEKAEKAEKAEKEEKPVAEKAAPKAQPAEKKPIEREEKPVSGSPAPALSSREPEGSNIDSAGVTKVINVSRAAIKRCYDKALTSNPMLKGKLSVKITINEEGRVSSTEVVDDSLHDAEVAKCVKGVIGRLRFPKPAGGTASVTFPFAFDPKNQ